MQGSITQAIALVLHGNAFLQRGRIDAGFFPHHPAFMFCEHVRFIEPGGTGRREDESVFADNPARWFGNLRSAGVFSLRLVYASLNDQGISDRMSVGFVGGGGRWLIEARHPSGADYWEARWEVGDRDHPDKLIWRVEYGRVARSSKAASIGARSPESVKKDLLSVLTEIERFANKHDLDGFAKYFRRGLDALSDGSPLDEASCDDLAPRGLLSVEARQLLAASRAAWVFGGMGSWNDLGFEGAEDAIYKTLSDRLFKLLNEASLVAVNTSAVDAEER